MKKLLFLGLALLLTTVSFAQVGIGTTTPNPSSVLDLFSTTKGLLLPRVTTVQRDAISLPATGLVLYNTTANQMQTNTGTPAAPIWTDASSNNATNIYNSNGTLSDNRTVSQGANTLAFTSTAVNGFSVDGTTFSVDAANNKIGIGTIGPAAALEIVNNNTGDNSKDDINIKAFGATAAGGIFLTKSRGILTAPTNVLNNDNMGAIYFGGHWNNALNSLSGSSIISSYKGDGTTGLTNLQFSTSAIARMIINENGNVGVGTTSPSVKLDARAIVGDGDIGIGSSGKTAATAGAGAMRYNTTSATMEYSDGNTWNNISKSTGNIGSSVQQVNSLTLNNLTGSSLSELCIGSLCFRHNGQSAEGDLQIRSNTGFTIESSSVAGYQLASSGLNSGLATIATFTTTYTTYVRGGASGGELITYLVTTGNGENYRVFLTLISSVGAPAAGTANYLLNVEKLR